VHGKQLHVVIFSCAFCNKLAVSMIAVWHCVCVCVC